MKKIFIIGFAIIAIVFVFCACNKSETTAITTEFETVLTTEVTTVETTTVTTQTETTIDPIIVAKEELKQQVAMDWWPTSVINDKINKISDYNYEVVDIISNPEAERSVSIIEKNADVSHYDLIIREEKFDLYTVSKDKYSQQFATYNDLTETFSDIADGEIFKPSIINQLGKPLYLEIFAMLNTAKEEASVEPGINLDKLSLEEMILSEDKKSFSVDVLESTSGFAGSKHPDVKSCIFTYNSENEKICLNEEYVTKQDDGTDLSMYFAIEKCKQIESADGCLIIQIITSTKEAEMTMNFVVKEVDREDEEIKKMTIETTISVNYKTEETSSGIDATKYETLKLDFTNPNGLLFDYSCLTPSSLSLYGLTVEFEQTQNLQVTLGEDDKFIYRSLAKNDSEVILLQSLYYDITGTIQYKDVEIDVPAEIMEQFEKNIEEYKNAENNSEQNEN